MGEPAALVRRNFGATAEEDGKNDYLGEKTVTIEHGEKLYECRTRTSARLMS